MTTAQINALDGMFKVCAFTKADISTVYSAFKTAFGIETVEVPATAITLSASVLSFASVESYRITATVVPSNATDGVVWSSDNEAVATVSEGVVTAVADGTCNITATAGTVSATCKVTVAIETPVVTYNVVNNLTNVTNSNSATTATGYYSANLTPADGYMMSNVTITMGGVDITDIAYKDDGTILISTLSGDVVITATAIEPSYIDTFGRTNVTLGYVNTSGNTSNLYNKAVTISNYPAKTDTVVDVVFTNNSDADITDTVMVAAVDSTQTANKAKISGLISIETVYDGKIGAGVSAKATYTIPANHHIVVICSKTNYENMTISVIGNMLVAELPESQYEITTTSKGTWTIYGDDGTGDSGYAYNSVVAYVNTKFTEEKTIRLIIDNVSTTNVPTESVRIVYLKEVLTTPGSYYYYSDILTNPSGIVPNGRGELLLTTKPGYYVGINLSLDGVSYSIVDAE